MDFWNPRWKLAALENTEPIPPSYSIVEFGGLKYIEWPKNPEGLPHVHAPQEVQYG